MIGFFKKSFLLVASVILLITLLFSNAFTSMATDEDDIKEHTGPVVCPMDEHYFEDAGWSYNENTHWNACKICGTKINEAVHTFSDWITDYEPSDGNDGQKHKTCTVCGYTVYEGEPPIASHIPGDIDGDNEETNQDLILLFQYLSGWDVTVNKAAVDVDNDGEETNQDLILLFQHLSGWSVTIY